MKLYDYFRSSASYRVRIALNLKGIEAELLPVDLKEGAQKSADYAAINPQQRVPTLELDDGTRLYQSLAIIDYLEETYPTPALLPENTIERAHCRALAQLIVQDIHPLNNLSVLQYLVGTVGVDENTKLAWYHHWIHTGFRAFEARLEELGSNIFCIGNRLTLADICLIPQVYNANRFDVDLTAYPRIRAINAHCLSLESFAKAAPTN